MKHNLIIADDHKMFLDGLLSILKTESNYNILFTAKAWRSCAKIYYHKYRRKNRPCNYRCYNARSRWYYFK